MTERRHTGSLSDKKSDLLALLLAQRGVQTGESPPERIPRYPRNGPLALSYGQQQLWFLEQLQPGSAAYVFTNAVHLSGPLHVAALERAIDEIIRRHEILRTRHVAADGRPAQVVLPAAPFSLPAVDLRGVPEEERQAKAERLAREEASTPFDVAHQALMRAKLLRLGEARFTLLLTLHHLVYDGWSLGIFFRELDALYAAFSRHQPAPLPELPIQYADYAQWQRQALARSALGAPLAYWKQKLSGTLPVLSLPTDRPRPSVQTFNGALHAVSLPERLTGALRALSQREGCTLFMLLLAAFKVLLYRYSGQDDVIVGSPVAGRQRAETEPLIGFFVNTLALRTDLSGEPSFRELLARVRATAMEALAHQDVPFEMLVEELRPRRDLSYNPIYQVMFALQNTPAPADAIGDVALRLEEVDSGTSLFDLTLSLWETAGGLKGWFEYNTDLFDPDTIARLGGHYRTLLESIAADPDRRIARLPLLSEAERTRMLGQWNETQAPLPADRCIHHLIEAAARRNPGAVAVACQGKNLTYAELDRKAERLARVLAARGVAPETFVGLCVERSAEMIVGILGVIKAGGAYVPLDPKYPKDRLAFMLRDTKAPVLLAQRHLVAELPPHDAEVVYLDGDWDESAADGAAASPTDAGPDNVVYAIYTSGSTGTPKGVVVTHRNLVHSSVARLRYYPQAVSGYVLLSSFAFDSSVAGIFWTLCQGGTLWLPEPEAEQDPRRIAELVERSGASHLLCLPSLYGFLLQEASPEELASLHTVIVAGEACPASLHALHLRSLPSAALYNEYGPTEATVWSTVYRFPASPMATAAPIGRPIPNAEIYLLDAHREPVPIGVAGEIYVGGAGVARGYLNRPELTREKFVPHPFPPGREARLYRTGDLARYRADGDIEFLGRVDHQVKIRGYRIELGEIEAALRTHPAIAEAVVVAREDGKAAKRLVGYVVVRNAPAPKVADVRTFLKDVLPDYMIPAQFAVLERLPLMPNGKVDYKALPDPQPAQPQSAAGSAAEPTNEVERKLADVWRQVLGLQTVGIHDNFFEVGGDSILSIQIIARARGAGVCLTPRQVFQHPTIAELARVAQSGSSLRAEAEPAAGRFPLTPIQRWFFERPLPNPHYWNQPYLLEVPEALHVELLEQALAHVALHHDALRLRFHKTNSVWQQEIAPAANAPPVQYCDLAHFSAPAQAAAMESIAAELQARLDLSAGKLIAAALFERGAAGDRLLLAIHHLAVDGVSWRVLLEDLDTAYRQLQRGEPVRLPPKTTSYKTWAERLAEYANSDALRREQAYWLHPRIRGAFRVPIDFPGGLNTEASERRVVAELGREETSALLQQVPAAYNTRIDELLLTAMTMAFTRWMGGEVFALELEGHGREDVIDGVDLSRTVGWFTSVFPMTLELKTTEPGAAIKSVKEQLRRIPQRGIGFGILRYLSDDPRVRDAWRGAAAAPVLYNYLGRFDRTGFGLFKPTLEPVGPCHDPRGPRSHVIEIDAIVMDGRLRLDWVYSENLHRRQTIEALAEDCTAILRRLIAHCLSPEAGGFSPSDFPEAELDQAALDELVQQLGGR